VQKETVVRKNMILITKQTRAQLGINFSLFYSKSKQIDSLPHEHLLMLFIGIRQNIILRLLIIFVAACLSLAWHLASTCCSRVLFCLNASSNLRTISLDCLSTFGLALDDNATIPGLPALVRLYADLPDCLATDCALLIDRNMDQHVLLQVCLGEASLWT